MGNPMTDPRHAAVDHARRIVVKVGTRLLSDVAGVSDCRRIAALVAELHAMREAGYEVILVSSGAIGAALRLLELPKRPRDLPRLQALAALGQCRLMALYEHACQQLGFHCGQILLSPDDLRDRQRHLNICNCLNALIADRILPIINENDSVAIDEIGASDNDRLAALVATMVRADLTILLTTVDGLRTRGPDGSLGERIPLVEDLNREIRAMATGTDGNPFSSGGMESKIKAAEICTSAGESLWVADGSCFGVLRAILAGHDVGTLFTAGPTRLRSAKRFLAFFTRSSGHLTIDPGAAEALQHRGRSLLPRGITAVEGSFAKGDTVTIRNQDGDEIGTGISNYAADDLRRIAGLRSTQIAATLGRDGYDEAIHRDNMVIR